MNKKKFGNFVLLSLSIALCLLICELLIRALDLDAETVYVEKWRMRLSDNPIIGYEPIPNLQDETLSMQHYGYRGASNNMGYRDYDHPLQKPTGSKRALVIGDSVTAGLWINEDENVFSAVMEKHLNARGIKSDVMNFGVSGYNTRQEVETLRVRGLQYKPDLVVVAYCLNDRSQDDGNILGLLLAEERNAAENNVLNAGRVNPIVKNSALLRLLTYKVMPSFAAENTAASDTATQKINGFYSDTVEDSFAKLAQLSSIHNFEVLLTVFPDFAKNDGGLTGRYALAKQHEALAAIAKQHQFHHLDLLDAMRTCKSNAPKGYNISYDRYHPNPLGSRCAGEAIAEKVAEVWTQSQ